LALLQTRRSTCRWQKPDRSKLEKMTSAKGERRDFKHCLALNKYILFMYMTRRSSLLTMFVHDLPSSTGWWADRGQDICAHIALEARARVRAQQSCPA
jgi:hypothetical protein